jgi:hypothetical protein
MTRDKNGMTIHKNHTNKKAVDCGNKHRKVSRFSRTRKNKSNDKKRKTFPIFVM